MVRNIVDFCEICRLSASRHRHRAMAFQVPVLPFWWKDAASPFRQTCIWDCGGYKDYPQCTGEILYSGIGDMVSKITALYDWIFEEEHGYGKVNDFAVMIAKKAVNSFVRTPFTSIQDDLFLKELLDSLAMSGIANEIAGSSAPTSGSEHLISHALDKMLEHPQLHGIQVGIATYLMSVVQDHRYRRVDTIFMQTGFWDYVKTLDLRREDFEKAVDLAPSIKPFRYTYLHEQQYRDRAKELLHTDARLQEILK